MRSILKTVCLLLILLASACVRDEARPISEILADAQREFSLASRDHVPAAAKDSLNSLAASLNDLINGSPNANSVAESIEHLTEIAGYTARPAFGELSKQYRALDQKTGKDPEVRLLVARTYTLLSSELGSTAFRLG